MTQVEQRPFESLWQKVLAKRRHKAAIFSNGHSTLRTFQEIEEERTGWRNRLSTFSPGDCIVAAIGNEPGWPAFLLACWDKSLIVAPIEPDLPADQLDRVFQLTQAQ